MRFSLMYSDRITENFLQHLERWAKRNTIGNFRNFATTSLEKYKEFHFYNFDGEVKQGAYGYGIDNNAQGLPLLIYNEVSKIIEYENSSIPETWSLKITAENLPAVNAFREYKGRPQIISLSEYTHIVEDGYGIDSSSTYNVITDQQFFGHLDKIGISLEPSVRRSAVMSSNLQKVYNDYKGGTVIVPAYISKSSNLTASDQITIPDNPQFEELPNGEIHIKDFTGRNPCNWTPVVYYPGDGFSPIISSVVEKTIKVDLSTIDWKLKLTSKNHSLIQSYREFKGRDPLLDGFNWEYIDKSGQGVSSKHSALTIDDEDFKAYIVSIGVIIPLNKEGVKSQIDKTPFEIDFFGESDWDSGTGKSSNVGDGTSSHHIIGMDPITQKTKRKVPQVDLLVVTKRRII